MTTQPEITRYADRDLRALGKHYLNHVHAMTAEGLHEKSDIAAELAYRDSLLTTANERIEQADERERKLLQDVDRLGAELSALRASLRAKAEEWGKEYRIWHMPGARDDDTGEEDDGNVYAATIKVCVKEVRALLEKSK